MTLHQHSHLPQLHGTCRRLIRNTAQKPPPTGKAILSPPGSASASLSHTHQLDFSIPSVHLPDACQRLRRMKLLKGRRASLPGSSSTPSLPPSSFSEHLSPASSSLALASTIDVEHIAPVPPTTSHMPNKGRAGEGKFPPSSFSLGRSLGLGLNRKDKRKGRQISSEASTPSSQLAVEPVLTEDAVGHGAVGASRLSIPKPTLAPARPAS